MSTDSSLADYYAEAASWDRDRAGELERRARTAWIVAGVSLICLLACVTALVVLMPLKSVEPFLVRVDSRSGIVDFVPPYDGRGTLDETITRYLLTHYVTVCERFSWSTAESDYEECAAFNSAQRNQVWAEAWATANPASPLNAYKDGSTLHADVQSVTFFTRSSGLADLAQVRFVKALRRGNGADEQRTYWIATIQYAYAKPSVDPSVRRWNPLGLRIIDYRPEAESTGARGEAASGARNPVEKE
ncbi:virB8 family protein [Peristeroidobacter soli]|uniref:virB8 family protein n=1 Tax=Peristeroidobacter soli TaxID=2497877 RepID=UPI00101D0CB5|nr:type IV secretion system protein [Peristeroidobacter soli]